MDEIFLRPMLASDLATVMSIERCLFTESWTKDMFIQEMQKYDAWVLTGTQQDIIGYACGWTILDEYSITNIGISPQFQRSGFASFMISQILLILAERAMRICYLEVRASNTAAINLYKKFGFINIGTRKNYYQTPCEDAMLMALDIVLVKV